MSAIFDLLAGPIGTFILAGIGLAGAVLFGVRRGRKAEQDRQMRERMKAREEADDVADAVAGRSDDEVKQRMRDKWQRP